MSSSLTTQYAPTIARSLNGVLLVYKRPQMTRSELIRDLRQCISEELNQYSQRPLMKRLCIDGAIDEEKRVIEKPNLADHPLVVGPRYVPWETRMKLLKPHLGYYSSGLDVALLNSANQGVRWSNFLSRFVSVYQVSGCFGFVMDNFFFDGKIQDKTTYRHIRTGRMDSVLARIESVQTQRIFETANVPLNSKEAYELATSWPSMPKQMNDCPVIFRIRCIHLKVPKFKIELTVVNENENFIAHLIHDIGLMLKSGAYTESIRRVKFGPYSVDDALTDRDWNIQSIVDNLHLTSKMGSLNDVKRKLDGEIEIDQQYRPSFG